MNFRRRTLFLEKKKGAISVGVPSGEPFGDSAIVPPNFVYGASGCISAGEVINALTGLAYSLSGFGGGLVLGTGISAMHEIISAGVFMSIGLVEVRQWKLNPAISPSNPLNIPLVCTTTHSGNSYLLAFSFYDAYSGKVISLLYTGLFSPETEFIRNDRFTTTYSTVTHPYNQYGAYGDWGIIQSFDRTDEHTNFFIIASSINGIFIIDKTSGSSLAQIGDIGAAAGWPTYRGVGYCGEHGGIPAIYSFNVGVNNFSRLSVFGRYGGETILETINTTLTGNYHMAVRGTTQIASLLEFWVSVENNSVTSTTLHRWSKNQIWTLMVTKVMNHAVEFIDYSGLTDYLWVYGTQHGNPFRSYVTVLDWELLTTQYQVDVTGAGILDRPSYLAAPN